MVRKALEERKIKTEKFVPDANEDNTDWKPRGKPGNKHSIYVLQDSPHISPK